MGKNFDRSCFKFKEVVHKLKNPILELAMIHDILAHHHGIGWDARVKLNKRATTKTGSRSFYQADKTYSPT
jgi:hypothetical protein